MPLDLPRICFSGTGPHVSWHPGCSMSESREAVEKMVLVGPWQETGALQQCLLVTRYHTLAP